MRILTKLFTKSRFNTNIDCVFKHSLVCSALKCQFFSQEILGEERLPTGSHEENNALGAFCVEMESSCKNNIRKVKLKGDTMVISVVACGICDKCSMRRKDIRTITIRETEDEIESAYGRWMSKREEHIREVITLD